MISRKLQTIVLILIMLMYACKEKAFNNPIDPLYIDSSDNGKSGCMDEAACNYNPDATENDDSCAFEKDCNDCDKFLNLIQFFDPEIHFLPIDESTSLDSIYTHDPCIVSNNGIIICNMGKKE